MERMGYEFQSTHPLRGATLLILPTRLHQDRFQSTHPLRGATAPQEIMPHVEAISIHAPLAGCDQAVVDKKQDRRHISIHAPLAGCDFWLLSREAWIQISIHAPLAGCDCPSSGQAPRPVISIHAPLAGCDVFAENLKKLRKISIHAPLAGCDDCSVYLVTNKKYISIHAPLAGCDPIARRSSSARPDFNPRTPCGVRHG